MNNNQSTNFKSLILSIVDYKNEIKRNLILLFSVVLLFGLGGYFYADQSKDKYQAVLSFIVENQSSSDINLASSFGTMAPFMQGVFPNVSSSLSEQQSVIVILKSRKIIKKALYSEATIDGSKDNLLNHYIRINNIMQDSSLFNSDSLLQEIYESIKDDELEISFESNDANILNIIYDSPNREFAIYFTKSLIREMSKDYIDIQTEAPKEFLRQMKDSLIVSKRKLDSCTKRWLNLKDINRYTTRNGAKSAEYEAESKTLEYKEEYRSYLAAVKDAQMKLIEKSPLIRIIDDSDELYLKNIKRSHLFWILTFCFLGLFFTSFTIILRKLVRDTLLEN